MTLPQVLTSQVLVVEDDRTVAEVVTRYLQREGFSVETVGDGNEALRCFGEHRPDIVVLDLMLPGLDGMEVFRRLREVAAVPVIMLTAKGSERERILGLDLGADDYVTKPFSPRELTARVKSVLRRSNPKPAVGGPTPVEAQVATRLVSGDLEIDVRSHEMRRDGDVVPLTAKEFDLLVFLMSHPRQAFRREELLEQVWGWSYGDTSTITVHVRRLREKVEAEPSAPVHIRTVWGVGYRFEP